jgi:4-alpha-glucanotransferase
VPDIVEMIRMLCRRRAGVLLHPTSLPGAGAHGTLGAEAHKFVDFLHSGGFSVWQTLPLGPVDAHRSPYRLRSAHAGDPGLIDVQRLEQHEELPRRMAFAAVRESPLDAFCSFWAAASDEQQRRFAEFMRRHRRWLLAYGLFEVCRSRFDGEPWWLWPRAFRKRDLPTVLGYLGKAKTEFRAIAFEQYLFRLQWSALKRHANAQGVFMFGDLPFYVDRNSVEVWWNRALFELDAHDEPLAVAGVPPDYFSAEGQLWGNPLYDWPEMSRQGFAWWIERIRNQLDWFDLLRIDHFLALESYWAVPASASTAREGSWRAGFGHELLGVLRRRLGDLPLVAEDLGIVTDGVRALRDRFELPGMVVLQFAFDGASDNPHLPSNHRRNAVVYTGTHDNDTTVGWYSKLDAEARQRINEMLDLSEPDVPEFLVEECYASRAQLAIVPLQDLLGLGSESRMNTPGTTQGNWSWRFRWDQIASSLADACRQRAERHGRSAG